MKVTIDAGLLESVHWSGLAKSIRNDIEADMGLRDNAIYRSRTMERVRRALEIPGVLWLTLEDNEAVQLELLMRENQR